MKEKIALTPARANLIDSSEKGFSFFFFLRVVCVFFHRPYLGVLGIRIKALIFTGTD